MATPLAIALRKQAALDRIVKALGIDPTVQGRDSVMNEVIILERIADASEAERQKALKSIAKAKAAVEAARDEAEAKPMRSKVGKSQ